MPLFDDSRSAWGARKPKNEPTYVDPNRRTEFFVHYDGGTPINVNTHADCLARVLQDQRYHMSSNGWSDIGYNGLVCQHGRAIEGRGIDYAGAHCPDHNTTGYGFQFMVGGAQVPTPQAYARMAQLFADCSRRSSHALAKKGHRDGFATACPGDAIYAWVKAGMRAPNTTTPPVPKEFLMALDDKAQQRLLDAAERILQTVRLRYYVPQPDGTLKVTTDADVAGAKKAYVLDNIDGWSIRSDAIDPNELAAAVKAQGVAVDTNELAAALAKAITTLATKETA